MYAALVESFLNYWPEPSSLPVSSLGISLSSGHESQSSVAGLYGSLYPCYDHSFNASNYLLRCVNLSYLSSLA